MNRSSQYKLVLCQHKPVVSAVLVSGRYPEMGVDKFIKASQDFETELNFKRGFTGSLERILETSSSGRIGIVKVDSCIEVDGN